MVDAILESAGDDNVVVALEITLDLSKPSSDVVFGFLQWFLKKVWTILVERHLRRVRNRAFVRVITFLLTDLRPQQFPSELCVAAPESDYDKLTVVNVGLWAEEDVKTWIHKFSKLKSIGTQTSELDDFGVSAHYKGEGYPRWTWDVLHDLMYKELTLRIEGKEHGELAAVQI